MIPLPMSRRRAPVFASFIVACVSAAPAAAQWSGDPATNLVIADAPGGQAQPKIAAAPDGGYRIAWFDFGGGFDVRLQRLDAGGHAAWTHEGVLVAERGYEFTYDYGIAVDGDGNAYVAFNCCANGSDDEHIAVSKVAPDGSLAWGSGGITVSAPGSVESVYNAYVAVLDDGTLAVAWSADGGVRVQKLDAAGQALWAAGGVALTQPIGAKLLGGVQPGGGGSAIVSWNNISGSAHTLRAQKLASGDGAPLWGSDAGGVPVFASGWLQFGYNPPFVADGVGGAVFHDYDQVGDDFVARVQHLDATGMPRFGAEGTWAAVGTGMEQTSTAVAYDAASGDVYAVWRDTYDDGAFHDYDGVSAQRIDAAGLRRWGDAGKVLVEPALASDCGHSISQLTALPAPGGVLAGWTTGCSPVVHQVITVARLDADGDYAWDGQTRAIKSMRETARTEAVIGADGSAVYVWEDGEKGASIRAQNLRLDGRLGVDDTVFADGFDG